MLGELPLEVLRLIRAHLTPEAALCFAHSCKATYHACDDWIIWRIIVKGSVSVTRVSMTELWVKSTGDTIRMPDTSIARYGDEFYNRTTVECFMPQLVLLSRKYRDFKAFANLIVHEQTQWQHL